MRKQESSICLSSESDGRIVKNICLYLRSIMSVLLQGCSQTLSFFCLQRIKRDSKIVVTEAETAPDSVTRVKVRFSKQMFYCNCHVHDGPETDSARGYSFSASVNFAPVRLGEEFVERTSIRNRKPGRNSTRRNYFEEACSVMCTEGARSGLHFRQAQQQLFYS